MGLRKLSGLRNPNAITQLIDTAQRLRIVRQAQREFLRLWTENNSNFGERFSSINPEPNQQSKLRSRRVFDDE